MNQVENLIQSLNKKKNKKIVENFLSSLQCHICHELINVPMMLTCGHIYCYMCLKNWFKTNETRKLGCPDCRKVVEVVPIFNVFLDNQLKFILDLIINDNQSKSSEWGKLLLERKEDETIYKNDIAKDTIFANVFKNSTLAIIDMDDDGIPRCGNCHWELDPDDMDDDEGENLCPHCHYRIRNDVITGGNSENVMSNSARNITNNLRGHEYEYSEGEYEEIIDEIRRFSDSDLEDDSDEEEENDKKNDRRIRKRKRKDTGELYDEEAIDEDYDSSNEEKKDKEEEEEHDSDLDSFVASDDELSEAEESKSNRKREHSKLIEDKGSEDSKREYSSDYNSDFYEHNDGDGFVSGDSLNNGSSIESNSDDHRTLSSDNEGFVSSRKRLRKAQVMTSDEE